MKKQHKGSTEKPAATEQTWARKATPHNELFAAVDKIIHQQSTNGIRVQHADGPMHGREVVELARETWSAILNLARQHGVTIESDRRTIGREQGSRLYAALRAGRQYAHGWSEEGCRGFEAILTLLHAQCGLLISGV